MFVRLTLTFRKTSNGKLEVLQQQLVDTSVRSQVRGWLERLKDIAALHAVSVSCKSNGQYRIVEVPITAMLGTITGGKTCWVACQRHFIPGWKQVVKNGRKRWEFTSVGQLTLTVT